MLNQITYLSEEQFNNVVKNGSITENGQTVEFSEDQLYLVPKLGFYKYHIRLTASFDVGGVTNIYIAEFDIYSQSSNLFSTSNTVAVNWGIFHSLYANQRIPVALQVEGGPEYRLSGAVSLIIPATATEEVIFEGGVYNFSLVSSYYVIDTAPITGFEFTAIEQ